MTREIEYLIKTVYDVPKAQLTMYTYLNPHLFSDFF